MKNTKLTIKFFLIIALFTTSVFADGHMGGGGLTDDGHMGGGGRTCDPQTQTCVVTCNAQIQNCTGNRTATENGGEEGSSIFSFVKEFLASLLG